MYTWTFQQLGGERKKLELTGWAAPFGRPRGKQPILKETVKSRVKTVRYPGFSGPPTRHSFGTHWEDMELSGRWMTKAFTDGTVANDFAQDWIDFVRDEQPVRVSWGLILSYDVFIEELELSRESEHEIAWKMKLLVDSSNASTKPKATIPRLTQESLADIFLFLFNSNLMTQASLPDMPLSILESLDFLAGALNTFSAEANKLAGMFDDLENASFTTIQHFRGALTGFRTALLTFRETLTSARIHEMQVIQNAAGTLDIAPTAEAEIGFEKFQVMVDDETEVILSILADLDKRTETMLRTKTSKVIVAEDGDTWESLSTRATGSPDNAAAMRAANGARFGEKPQSAKSYLAP